MFRGSVKGTGYPPHSPFPHSLPLPCFTVCHHIATGVYLQCLSCTWLESPPTHARRVPENKQQRLIDVWGCCVVSTENAAFWDVRPRVLVHKCRRSGAMSYPSFHGILIYWSWRMCLPHTHLYCTYQITRVNIIEDIHLQCKFPFMYFLLYHSMLHDRSFLRRRYTNQTN